MTHLNIFQGVNILGYFKGHFGVAEIAKLILMCIEKSNIPYVVNNLSCKSHAEYDDGSIIFSSENPYPINIIIDNGFANDLTKTFSKSYFDDKYNVGVWCWETEYLLNYEPNNLTHYNEVWTISDFCKKAFEKTIRLPISTIKLPVRLPIIEQQDRQKIHDLFPNGETSKKFVLWMKIN